MRPALGWAALSAALGCSGTPALPPPPSGSDSAAALDTGPPDRSGLAEHGPITCSDPAARLEAPYELVSLGDDWEEQTPPGWSGEFRHGRGLVIADLSGDGLADVLLPDRSRPQLFIGQADHSLRRVDGWMPTPSDLADEEHWRITIASAADADGDGDLDLILGSDRGRDRLLLGDGAGGFTDGTEAAGLPDEIVNLKAAPWGDLDGDGDLDLLLGAESLSGSPPEPGDRSTLLLGDGGGRFEDISDRLSEEVLTAYTQVAAVLDVDADGDQDLYVINHRSEYTGNHLLLNDGLARFTAAPEAGLDVSIEGMGLGVGDLNGDGRVDLLMSSEDELYLMESAGASWYRSDISRGLVPELGAEQRTAWGAELADLNNDGLLDAAVVFAPSGGDSSPDEQPDGVWVQRADGSFEAVAGAWGLDQRADNRSLAVVDWNGDGWLDIFKSGVDERATYYQARCGAESWLAVSLEGAAPNTRAVGSVVAVEAGGQVQRRWVLAGSTSFYTSVAAPVHFGLGEAERVDRLTVTWPDGSSSSWRDLAVRQRVTATQEVR